MGTLDLLVGEGEGVAEAGQGRVAVDAVSAAIAGGGEPSFGRADAVAQATALRALYHSAEVAAPVDLARP